jgi:U4/U6.U5 tri-snRNP-associated protein 2
MAKRQAAEALEDIAGTDSPASKRARSENFHELHNGSELPARTKAFEATAQEEEDVEGGLSQLLDDKQLPPKGLQIYISTR